MRGVQKRLARHALGLPNERKQSYRNRYHAAFNSREYLHWMAMCRCGYAERGALTRNIGDMGAHRPRFFWLTNRGAKLAVNPGETLDKEDFS